MMQRLQSDSMGVKAMTGALLALGIGLLVQFPGTPIFAQDAKLQPTIEKAFPNSNKCKRCHERVFEEWETSPLSKSIHSAAFRASLDAYLNSSACKDKALCVRCHAPPVRESP